MKSAVKLSKPLLKFALLCRVDIQKHFCEDNAKFNFLGIVWVSKRSWRVHFPTESLIIFQVFLVLSFRVSINLGKWFFLKYFLIASNKFLEFCIQFHFFHVYSWEIYYTDATQGSTYLFEVLSWRFILSQP